MASEFPVRERLALEAAQDGARVLELVAGWSEAELRGAYGRSSARPASLYAAIQSYAAVRESMRRVRRERELSELIDVARGES